MKRIILMLTVAALLVAAMTVSAVSAFAAPLPSNCTKQQGTVTCTSGPGKNQGGVGTTTTSQGNTTNKQQSTCRPANAGFC